MMSVFYCVIRETLYDVASVVLRSQTSSRGIFNTRALAAALKRVWVRETIIVTQACASLHVVIAIIN